MVLLRACRHRWLKPTDPLSYICSLWKPRNERTYVHRNIGIRGSNAKYETGMKELKWAVKAAFSADLFLSIFLPGKDSLSWTIVRNLKQLLQCFHSGIWLGKFRWLMFCVRDETFSVNRTTVLTPKKSYCGSAYSYRLNSFIPVSYLALLPLIPMFLYT